MKDEEKSREDEEREGERSSGDCVHIKKSTIAVRREKIE